MTLEVPKPHLNLHHVDRSTLDSVALGEQADDRAYWLRLSAEERLAAVEFLRQVIYGYDPATARLQRVLVVAELGAG